MGVDYFFDTEHLALRVYGGMDPSETSPRRS
jgi:hypothetical protein